MEGQIEHLPVLAPAQITGGESLAWVPKSGKSEGCFGTSAGTEPWSSLLGPTLYPWWGGLATGPREARCLTDRRRGRLLSSPSTVKKTVLHLQQKPSWSPEALLPTLL